MIAALLLIVGALAAVGFARREARLHEQNTLASIASELAGRKVGVRCPGFLSSLVDTRGEAGRGQFDDSGRPAAHTHLSPSTGKGPRPLDPGHFTCIDSGAGRLDPV